MRTSNLFFSEGEEGSYYYDNLHPILTDLENRRKRVFTISSICISISLLIFILACIIKSVLLLCLVIIGFFVIIMVLVSMIGNYLKSYKREVIPRLIKYYDDTLVYERAGFIPCKRFVKSSLYWTAREINNKKKKIVHYGGEDLIEGQIGKTKLILSELKSQVREEIDRDQDGNPKYVYYPLFNGLFFIADFNKNIQAKTFVYPDYTERLLGNFGKL